MYNFFQKSRNQRLKWSEANRHDGDPLRPRESRGPCFETMFQIPSQRRSNTHKSTSSKQQLTEQHYTVSTTQTPTRVSNWKRHHYVIILRKDNVCAITRHISLLYFNNTASWMAEKTKKNPTGSSLERFSKPYGNLRLHSNRNNNNEDSNSVSANNIILAFMS